MYNFYIQCNAAISSHLRDALSPISSSQTCIHCIGHRYQLGTWCSGITSASHAEGPGLNPQCVQDFLKVFCLLPPVRWNVWIRSPWTVLKVFVGGLVLSKKRMTKVPLYRSNFNGRPPKRIHLFLFCLKKQADDYTLTFASTVAILAQGTHWAVADLQAFSSDRIFSWVYKWEWILSSLLPGRCQNTLRSSFFLEAKRFPTRI